MKRNFFIFVFLFCGILAGCRDRLEITPEIIFVYQRTNWAEGYQNYGYYIDNAGNRVAFDVSDKDEKYADISELAAFLANRTDLEGRPCLEEKNLEKYYKWLTRISDDYQLEKGSSGSADVGSYCLYGIRYDDTGKMVPVLLSEDGDWITVNTDRYAQKLAEELGKLCTN